jgi:enoyl-CoA hydratase/3-hydroxyacyl-CoA dehydrogenase
MTIPEINTVCFIGAGNMGSYNAMVAAISGYQVTLYDIDQAILDAVPQRLREHADFLVAGGYSAEQDIPAAMARIAVLTDMAAATRNADLVSESVFERLDIKRDIHRQLDAVCPPHTILTTNSSSLMVSEIEDVVSRGDRFAALHTHLGSPLVDIVPGPRTDSTICELLERYITSTGGTALMLKKEYPGYVLNAMLGPVMGAAMQLAVDPGASIEDIDRAWMLNHKGPMGPFGMIDLFGLPLLADGLQREGDSLKEMKRPQVLALLQSYIDRGELGMKTGRGFYQYPEPAYQQADFAEGSDATDGYHEALLCTLISHGILIAIADILPPAEIDKAWKLGTWLNTGPFEILSQMGNAAVAELVASERDKAHLAPEKAEPVLAWLAANKPAA